MVIPALGNYLVALLKDTSLVSVLSVQELLFGGQLVAARTYDYFSVYTMVFGFHLAIGLPALLLVRYLERRSTAGFADRKFKKGDPAVPQLPGKDGVGSVMIELENFHKSLGTGRCCAASTSRSSAVKWSASSGRPAAERPRCRGARPPVCRGRRGHLMTETVVGVEPSQNDQTDPAAAAIDIPLGREVDELDVAGELMRQAREAGVALTGRGGLLRAMTKTVIETVRPLTPLLRHAQLVAV
ncbi:hypothetical protein MMUR_28840 [Mycolicibacterium murale]|uniref:Uncharacterized protein n=1 Tax=Mycolicibacterium murale TaxID=182220 RepID=A0A7I9WN33_9MYCO|nr:hypothetical protein MMUR_28840 [Mycolicibacterium murale]